MAKKWKKNPIFFHQRAFVSPLFSHFDKLLPYEKLLVPIGPHDSKLSKASWTSQMCQTILAHKRFGELQCRIVMAMELDSSHHHPFHLPFNCLFSCNSYAVMLIFVHNDKDQDNEKDDLPTIIEPLMKVLGKVMAPPLPPFLFVASTFVVITSQTRKRRRRRRWPPQALLLLLWTSFWKPLKLGAWWWHGCSIVIVVVFAIVFGHTVIGHKQKPRKRKKGGERKKEEGAFIDDKAKSPFGSYCFFFLVQSF